MLFSDWIQLLLQYLLWYHLTWTKRWILNNCFPKLWVYLQFWCCTLLCYSWICLFWIDIENALLSSMQKAWSYVRILFLMQKGFACMGQLLWKKRDMYGHENWMTCVGKRLKKWLVDQLKWLVKGVLVYCLPSNWSCLSLTVSVRRNSTGHRVTDQTNSNDKSHVWLVYSIFLIWLFDQRSPSVGTSPPTSKANR